VRGNVIPKSNGRWILHQLEAVDSLQLLANPYSGNRLPTEIHRKAASLSENPKTRRMGWKIHAGGQHPYKMSIIRGPRCLTRLKGLDLDPDRDSDWETEPEAEDSNEDEPGEINQEIE
jgi:hypothetical protein